MAVTLTASNSLAIQVRANRMWSEKTAERTQYENEVSTIRKLMSSQNLRFLPIMDNAGQCIGWKVWWIDLTDLNAQAIYSGTVRNPSASGCDLADGATVGTLDDNYTPNVYLSDPFYVDDNLCANDETFVNLSEAALSHAMLKARIALNTRAIQFLNTNATANLDTTVVGTDGIVLNGVITEVPAATMNDPAFLLQLQIMAESNRISDYLILDSTNLLLSKNLAPYLGLNDDQKSFGAIYGAASGRYNYDMRQMASVVGAPVTFLANPNMFGYFNRVKYGRTPELLDPATGMYGFSIADPFLTYKRQEVNANGTVTGMVDAPVEYDVLYQKDCVADRDTTGRPVYRHKWELMHEGGMLLGPTSTGGATGILKIEKISGI